MDDVLGYLVQYKEWISSLTPLVLMPLYLHVVHENYFRLNLIGSHSTKVSDMPMTQKTEISQARQ